MEDFIAGAREALVSRLWVTVAVAVVGLAGVAAWIQLPAGPPEPTVDLQQAVLRAEVVALPNELYRPALDDDEPSDDTLRSALEGVVGSSPESQDVTWLEAGADTWPLMVNDGIADLLLAWVISEPEGLTDVGQSVSRVPLVAVVRSGAAGARGDQHLCSAVNLLPQTIVDSLLTGDLRNTLGLNGEHVEVSDTATCIESGGVTIAPEAGFVQRLGGEHSLVSLPWDVELRLYG